MKISKLQTLAESSEALQRLRTNPGWVLPDGPDALISYKVKKEINKITPEIANFENAKNDLVNKYGKKEKHIGGSSINPENKNWHKFTKEINELIEQKVDITIEQINIKELKGLKITPQDLETLNWLII